MFKAAAYQRLDTRVQLIEGKWFDQVIVGALLQTNNSILGLITR